MMIDENVSPYQAKGFVRGKTEAFVSVGPRFSCSLHDANNPCESQAHVNCDFYMRPEHARALAAELLAAADVADGVAAVTVVQADGSEG